MDLFVVIVYIAAMIGVGWYAKGGAKSEADFLVAGRRLGPVLYGGTMAAICLGGATTVGGIGLGYEYGISGMWLVFTIGLGVLLLSLVFAARINRLGVYTVSQMLDLRYGPGAGLLCAIVMCAYTVMVAVPSTIAYGAVFSVLFDIDRVTAILIGGGVVLLYSVAGGMWSITLTDFLQFVVKTVGIFLILVPICLIKVGGLQGLHASLPEASFSLTHIGLGTILSYFILYIPGLVIGQDIWQRVFTARDDGVARWAGAAAGVYCLLYALAGAVIGMCARVLLPGIASRDDVYTEIVTNVLPVGVAGLVVAAALAAIMSLSSGAIIGAATVAKEDIAPVIRRRLGLGAAVSGDARTSDGARQEKDEVRNSRWYILCLGLLVISIACVLKDVVAALTVAYAILVGGLGVAIIGGMLWKRATIAGAVASMIAGIVCTAGAMAVMQDVYAAEPIFVGLAASLTAFVSVSLCSARTPAPTIAEWERRTDLEQRTGSRRDASAGNYAPAAIATVRGGRGSIDG